MSAMTDRDRAVAEKLGWSQMEETGIANIVLWEHPATVYRKPSSDLRFCSNATWETEGMVIECIRAMQDEEFLFSFYKKLRERVIPKMPHVPMTTVYAEEIWFSYGELGDLANALADALEEQDDSQM